MNLEIKCSNTIIIEDSFLYRNVISDLQISINADSNKWIFSNDGIELKKSSMISIVNSIFMLEFENNKISNAIVNDMNEIALNEENFVKTQKLQNEIEKYLYELEWEMLYDINIEMCDIKNIIKSSYKGLIEPEDYVEKLISYIKIVSRLLKKEILLFIGVQNYFRLEEWKEIEKAALYEKVYIICIERMDYLYCNNKIIIDKDGCRVV